MKKNVEQEKKRQDQRIKSYQNINHGKNQRRLCGYKAKLLKFIPEPTLEYSVANVVTNGWLKIEDDEHMLYWVKGKIILSALVFNKKVYNLWIMYLQGNIITRNFSSKVVKSKEPWPEKHLKAIQFIFHHIYCIVIVTYQRRWWINSPSASIK